MGSRLHCVLDLVQAPPLPRSWKMRWHPGIGSPTFLPLFRLCRGEDGLSRGRRGGSRQMNIRYSDEVTPYIIASKDPENPVAIELVHVCSDHPSQVLACQARLTGLQWHPLLAVDRCICCCMHPPDLWHPSEALTGVRNKLYTGGKEQSSQNHMHDALHDLVRLSSQSSDLFLHQPTTALGRSPVIPLVAPSPSLVNLRRRRFHAHQRCFCIGPRIPWSTTSLASIAFRQRLKHRRKGFGSRSIVLHLTP